MKKKSKRQQRRHLKNVRRWHQRRHKIVLEYKTLEYQLTEILSRHVGERGGNEGAVDVLCRIIQERDRALTLLALDRLKELPW